MTLRPDFVLETVTGDRLNELQTDDTIIIGSCSLRPIDDMFDITYAVKTVVNNEETNISAC